mgnify:CR=1 FL=1
MIEKNFKKVICIYSNHNKKLKTNNQYLTKRERFYYLSIFNKKYEFIGFFEPYIFEDIEYLRNQRIDEIIKDNNRYSIN